MPKTIYNWYLAKKTKKIQLKKKFPTITNNFYSRVLTFFEPLVEQELIDWLHTNAGAEKVLDGASLSEEAIDRSSYSQRRLQHVAQDREDRMKVLVVFALFSFYLDSTNGDEHLQFGKFFLLPEFLGLLVKLKMAQCGLKYIFES